MTPEGLRSLIHTGAGVVKIGAMVRAGAGDPYVIGADGLIAVAGPAQPGGGWTT